MSPSKRRAVIGCRCLASGQSGRGTHTARWPSEPKGQRMTKNDASPKTCIARVRFLRKRFHSRQKKCIYQRIVFETRYIPMHRINRILKSVSIRDLPTSDDFPSSGSRSLSSTDSKDFEGCPAGPRGKSWMHSLFHRGSKVFNG